MIQIFRLLCLCFWMLLLPTGLLCAEGGDDVLARMIHLSKEKNTVYRLLDKVSEQTGFLFIYGGHYRSPCYFNRQHHQCKRGVPTHAARLASPVYALLLPLRLRTPQDRGLSSRRTTHGDHARCQNNPDPRSRSAHRQPTPPASRHERKHPEKLPAITRLPDYFLPGRNRTKK